MDYLSHLDNPSEAFISASGQHCAQLFTPETLALLSTSQKHKLAVKVSTLLKAKNLQRAFGTWLVPSLLQDGDILKSHAVSWCPILLHMLDLPDSECWAGAIKALCVLYTKADLRDLGSSAKIGDFVKRLEAILPSAPVPASRALRYLIVLNPGPVRTYIPKLTAQIHSILWSSCWQDLFELLAALTLAEKAPAAAWREQLIATLSDCTNLPTLKSVPEPPIAPHRIWFAAESYLQCRPEGSKLPTERLIKALETSLKASPAAAEAALKFMVRTLEPLGRVYMLHFDSLFHLVCESSNFGPSCLEASVKCTCALVNEVKTVPQKYLKAINTLFNRAFRATASASNTTAIPSPLASPTRLDQLLADLAVSTILASEQIPASFRSKLDAAALRIGGSPLRVATLYPGKFSMLPLSINYGSKLDGYETLVHPRLPPLSFSSVGVVHEEPEVDGPERVQITRTAPTPELVESVAAPLPQVELDVVPEATAAPAAPAAAPEAPTVQPQKRSEKIGENSPEKRQKIDEEVAAHPEAPMEAGPESDDDDEMVIPELEMDSD